MLFNYEGFTGSDPARREFNVIGRVGQVHSNIAVGAESRPSAY